MANSDEGSLLHIREIIDLRFHAHDREHQLIDRALEEFKEALSARLAGLNHVKEQTEKIEREFVRTSVYEGNVNDLERRIAEVEKTSHIFPAKDTGKSIESEKRWIYIGMALTLVIAFMSLLLALGSFVKKG